MKFDNLDVRIKDVQKVQLEILKEFDLICKKNDIEYQLFGGTLLGAVRHKGFIPWDDDLDVCMLREDYNKLLQIWESDSNGKYFLQNYKTDKEFVHSFSRIRKNNTLLVQKAWSEVDMHQGIFIDIFPMDDILPNKLIGSIHRHTVYIIRKIKRFKIKNVRSASSTKFIETVKTAVSILLKPFSMQSLNKFETRVASIFSSVNTIYATLLAVGDKNTYSRYIINKNEYHNMTEINFEGYKFPGPKNYKQVLINMYGDYEKLPPIAEQKPHHGIIEINFDTTCTDG